MEIFERINRAFGSWYEGLFGGGDDVRPKDILRKILVAMEEHRKEGFDSRVYVPNRYVLEIAVDDAEEKEYLLSFLDREELEAAVRRYCQQNHYHIRGGLDFTIKEVAADTEGKRRDKVRVRCRYDSTIPPPAPAESRAEPPEPELEMENPTVYGESSHTDMGTVAAVAHARLEIHPRGGQPRQVQITGPALSIGRSSRAGNDVVLDQDGMVSRRHARIERDVDGRFTLYDLDTTNGTRVNGRRIDNRTLASGDEISIGETRIVFHQDEDDDMRPVRFGREGSPASGRPARLVLEGGGREEEFVLASETLIGRGATNDISLPDRSMATRHVRIVRGNPFTLEPLAPNAELLLNERPVLSASPLRHGDRIRLGDSVFRFEDDRP